MIPQSFICCKIGCCDFSLTHCMSSVPAEQTAEQAGSSCSPLPASHGRGTSLAQRRSEHTGHNQYIRTFCINHQLLRECSAQEFAPRAYRMRVIPLIAAAQAHPHMRSSRPESVPHRRLDDLPPDELWDLSTLFCNRVRILSSHMLLSSLTAYQRKSQTDQHQYGP